MNLSKAAKNMATSDQDSAAYDQETSSKCLHTCEVVMANTLMRTGNQMSGSH